MKTQTNTWALNLMIGLFATALLSACGKSSSGSDGSVSGYGGSTVNCTNGVCTYPITPYTRVGFYSQTSNFYVPGYQNAGANLMPGTGMTAMLRDAMGVCDRAAAVGGYSGGYAACSQWASGAHDLVIYSDAGAQTNTVKLIIRSVPAYQTSYAWYSYSMPSFSGMIASLFGFNTSYNAQGYYDPMVLNATIWPVNNSQGFEVRAYGPNGSAAYNKLFQLQVATGKLEDAGWNFTLYYNGQTAMSGSAVRCQSQYCGMDTSYFNGGNY